MVRSLGKKRWLLEVMAIVGIGILTLTVSFVAGAGEGGRAEIPANLVGAPSSLTQMVSSADAVVVGTIGTSINETRIGPYSVTGSGFDAPRFPVTDYQVTVTTVLKGGEEVSPGDTVTLRQFGHLSKADASSQFFEKFPMSNIGDSLLFVLGKTPDNSAYGLLYGPYSRLALDGSSVEYSDLEGMEVKFARGVSPLDFLANIQSEVSRQGAQ